MSRFLRIFNVALVHTSRVLTALIAATATWFVVHAVTGALPLVPLAVAVLVFWWTMRYLQKPSSKAGPKP